MDFLRKKNSTVFESWHPDFRDLDGLPSFKMVRSGVLFRVGLFFVCIVLIGALAYVELRLAQLRDSIKVANEQIKKYSQQNQENLALSQEFVRNSKKVQLLEDFYSEPVVAVELLVDLAQSKPQELIFREISLSEGQVSLKDKSAISSTVRLEGAVKGSSDQALEVLGAYEELLQEQESLKNRISQLEVIALSRDRISGLFSYSILIRLRN